MTGPPSFSISDIRNQHNITAIKKLISFGRYMKDIFQIRNMKFLLPKPNQKPNVRFHGI